MTHKHTGLELRLVLDAALPMDRLAELVEEKLKDAGEGGSGRCKTQHYTGRII
jgi:hypothetical protein